MSTMEALTLKQAAQTERFSGQDMGDCVDAFAISVPMALTQRVLRIFLRALNHYFHRK